MDKAKEQEKSYNWIGAADFYEQASSWVLEDFLKAAELRERIGYCFLRAAFQAETNEEFRSRLKQSVEAYEKTAELHNKTEAEDKEAKINHAKAMVAYVGSRCTKDIPKRRDLLDEWLRLENEALNYYKQVGDQFAIGKTCNDIAERLKDKRSLESYWEAVNKAILEEIKYGEAAIAALSEVNDEFELARAYIITSKSYAESIWFRVINRSEEIHQNWKNYSKKALELSEKTGDAYLISLANLNSAQGRDVSKGSSHSLRFWKNGTDYGKIAKDKYLMGRGSTWTSVVVSFTMAMEVDPDKQRKGFTKALKLAQDGIRYLSIIDDYSVRFTAYYGYVDIVNLLESIETNLETKRLLLEKAVSVGRENLKGIGEETIMYCTILFHAFSYALFGLSKIETKLDKKLRLLKESLEWRKKQLTAMQQISPLDYAIFSMSHNLHAIILAELAKNETGERKIKLLEKAVSAMENCVELVEKDVKDSPMGIKRYGSFYYMFGGILEQLYTLTKDKKILDKAIEIYKGAVDLFSETEAKTRVAESYWQIARIKNHLGDNLESAHNYQTAAENYQLAAEKTPKLEDFYNSYSDYMQAWSEIEQAKHTHIIEEYEQSRSHYEKAANLHEKTELWSYLTPNYQAWTQMEKAEDHSRKDETQQALQTFKQARDYFKKSEDSLQTKLKEIEAPDEKTMVTNLINSSDMRQRYCQARISIEEAKIFDRNGKYGLSARSYGLATESLKKLIDETEYEQTLKELKIIMILSQAWQKMAQAEEKTSPELYLEAAQLFEQANKHSLTKKTSLLALGNSSFCKALAAGTKYQNTLNVTMHAEAKGHIKSAATYYLKAGFKSASEYAKATQRLFDAYLYMNNAEKESDPEKSAKYYQMAEKVLQISAESFMEAKQPEKKAEVQRILETVKEERELAFSLNEVLHAPAITSTTASFTTPTPTSEESVGLEKFEHANVQANLIAGVNTVKVGESFCLSIEFVNAGREPALLTRVEDFIPPDFVVVKKPEIYRMEDTCLNMKGKQLAPLKLVEVKLVLQPSKKGEYNLKPRIHYLDELGQNRSIQLKSVEIKVEEVVLSNRVSTGTKELDSLLLGGIPEGYAVVLTGPPSDEREGLIKNFLEAGTKEDQITFYVTTEADGLENLLEKSNFYLFLCNPKPKVQVPDLPNIYKLGGKTDLTNLSISLAKAYRNIDQSSKKRVCVEIVSDVLISYQAEATRRWISELITDMGTKGFTMLAVIDPEMHPSDHSKAVLNLFDGEINLYQTRDPLECKKSIRIEKLRNQDYIKNPICLL